MNHPVRREVADDLRMRVLRALEQDRYFIFPDGRHFLESVGFDPTEVIVTDLVDYLRKGKALYVLPGNPEKCQCCLNYEFDLTIHVKMNPKTESQITFVKLSFHRHNTGYPPLPE